MGASYDRAKAARRGRIEGRFSAMPHAVLHSGQYRRLGHIARSLLHDLTLQFNGNNNGSLVLCQKAMRPLGWHGNDSLSRATIELEASGLIIKTRQGRKPSLASWFALAWKILDVSNGLDIDPKSYRHMIYEPYDYTAAINKKSRPPPSGIGKRKTAPPSGVSPTPTIPTSGAVEAKSATPSIPTSGAYIDKPYPTVNEPHSKSEGKTTHDTTQLSQAHVGQPKTATVTNEPKFSEATTRERESEQDPRYFCHNTGAYKPPAPSTVSMKPVVQAQVKQWLKRAA